MNGIFRSDIQGMRAIAVLSVVIFHYFPHALPGGFIGVDVFFVISGYLITRSLLADGDYPLGERLARFYRRRVRRLFPALFAMLGLCLLAGAFVMFAPAYRGLALAAISSALFVSNFHFYRISGYFADASEKQPLLHTWSLSIEEQFYLLFPIVLFVLIRHFRKHMFVVALAGTLALFLLSEAFVWLRPVSSFYLTPARAFELAIGAVLALAPAIQVRRQVAEATGAAGLAAVVAGFWIITPTSRFPGAFALLPCLGAAAMLFAGAQTRTMTGRLISHQPLRYVGDISYSLYLWHWPVLAFVRYHQGLELSPEWLFGCLGVSVILAVLSYHFVERPFMKQRATQLPYLAGGALLIAAVVVPATAIVAYDGIPQRFRAGANQMLAARDDESPAQVRCHYDFLGRFVYSDTCQFGRGAAEVAIWGDSRGVEIAFALGERGAARGYAVRQVTASSCLPAIDHEPAGQPGCQAHNQEVLTALKADRDVRVVVLVLNLTDANAQAVAGLRRSAGLLRAQGKRVIVMLPFPSYPFDPPERLALRAQFGLGPDGQGMSRAAFEDKAGEARRTLRAAAASVGAIVYDPSPLFCDARRCELYREDVGVLYTDGNHPSLSVVRIAAGDLDRLIAASGVPVER